MIQEKAAFAIRRHDVTCSGPSLANICPASGIRNGNQPSVDLNLKLSERRVGLIVVLDTPQPRRTTMDREHVKGAADKAKGAIKEGAGKLTGDKDMEAEGKLDKAKGSAHNVAGDVKDAARDAADALKK
jgi:uncharacterized protein YjbJ (UPF0337 family)